MASFNNVPPELIAIITSLSDTETLKALRLTNHMLCAFATKSVFSTISLYTDDKSCETFESIITHPQLKEYVRKVRLNTVEVDYVNDLPSRESDREHDEFELPLKWKELLPMLPKIPNLESVMLRFDRNATLPEDQYPHAPQSVDYRETIIQWLGTGSVSLERPLKELGIRNQQNVTPLSNDFQRILGTLSSLRLNVAHTNNFYSPSVEIEREEGAEFHARILPSVWLKPTMGSLRKLSLYSNLYWGFYPKLRLEGVHCPNLQSLALGNFTFFEDQQLDWILSHSSTLEELYLDYCSILIKTRVLDADSHLAKCPIPKSRMKLRCPGEWGDAWSYHYPRRWNDYFASFETGLPHLRRCAIGRNAGWDSYTYEVPFEKELDLVPALMRDRYMEFDGSMGGAHFLSPQSDPQAEHWPECEDEDREALKALYRKIKQQVDYGEFDGGDYEVDDLVEVRF